MPHVTVPLSDAQARALNKRARAAQRPSDEILRDIVTTALDESVGDLEELDESAVDQAFADFAAAYPDLCDALFASDPDLGIEYHDDSDADEPAEGGQQVAEVTTSPADPSATKPEGADRAGSTLTSSDVDRAFSILAEQYEEIAEDLFRGTESRGTGSPEEQNTQSGAVEFHRTTRLFLLTRYLPVDIAASGALSAADDLTSHIYMQLPSDKRNPSGIVVLVSRDHLEELARLPKA